MSDHPTSNPKHAAYHPDAFAPSPPSATPAPEAVSLREVQTAVDYEVQTYEHLGDDIDEESAEQLRRLRAAAATLRRVEEAISALNASGDVPFVYWHNLANRVRRLAEPGAENTEKR